MNQTVQAMAGKATLGERQVRHQVTVFPITTECGADLAYVTLSEALVSERVVITEVSESGSVPELRVKNDGDVPVLIVDGEELKGAKQNRVCNTTVLLREKATTVLPVSCTEHGRWSYDSPEFADSGLIMERKVRTAKNRNVSASLERAHSYRGDQSEVWSQIHELHEELGSHSRTGAMRDAYESVREPLEEWMHAFPVCENQNGLLVCINGIPVGMDVVSRADAYARLHPRFLKSYIIGCVRRPSKEPVAAPDLRARDFLARLSELHESTFASPGYGEDFRYAGPARCGSALVHAGTCVHAAFFGDVAAENGAADMASMNERMRNRRRASGQGRFDY